MRAPRKEHLIQTAVELFRRRGYHATGIDRIIAEAGVAKMTLYKHFRSKDDLIVAALRRWDEDSRRWLIRAIEERADEPYERLLALFDVLDEWFDTPEYGGCMFINAAAEYPDPTDPIHRAAAEHKRLFREYLQEQVAACGFEDPDVVTGQLLLLMEGAIVTAQVSRQVGPGEVPLARRAAEVLLSQASRKLSA